MDCRKLASAIAGAALALYGCGPGGGSGTLFPERDKVCAQGAAQPCETSENAHTDAERTHEETGMDDATLTFVVSSLSIPEADGGAAAGFNLDGLDSGEGSTAAEANCEELARDFVSVTDPDHIGVDNALQGLVSLIGTAVGGNIDDTLLEQINSGSVLLLVEVSGVDSVDYDSSVTLTLYRGGVSGGSGTTCTADADCTTAGESCVSGACHTAPTVTDGALAPDQSFESLEMIGSPVQGDIFDGRVRATAERLTISVTASGSTLSLIVSNPELRFDISESGLTNGNIGGVLTIDDLAMAAAMIDPSYESLVRGATEDKADINPTADNPAICDALSVGILFGATTATRTGG